jgi:N-acetylglucosaminyl-diphospho-decaprenol L-rhamnosyltransferase
MGSLPVDGGSEMSERYDITIAIVSTNEAHWLTACLESVYAHAGSARLDVVVVDNESKDGTAQVVAEGFPQARVVRCPNRGFAHANNRALMTTLARHVLFLNPDTEIVEGTFGELVELLDARPDVGLMGVKQLDGDGNLYPTIRRFPNALRALGEAFTAESWSLRPGWLGERELDLGRYDQERDCDWTVGAYMLARREALFSAGFMDERFFLFSDEPDLCLRIKQAGWRIIHSPLMTIVHHAGKAGVKPRLVAQDALARKIYARKHFAGPHRALYVGALAARHAMRAVPRGRGESDAAQRAAARTALRTLFGREQPPFGAPPPTSVDPLTVPQCTAALENAGVLPVLQADVAETRGAVGAPIPDSPASAAPLAAGSRSSS